MLALASLICGVIVLVRMYRGCRMSNLLRHIEQWGEVLNLMLDLMSLLLMLLVGVVGINIIQLKVMIVLMLVIKMICGRRQTLHSELSGCHQMSASSSLL